MCFTGVGIDFYYFYLQQISIHFVHILFSKICQILWKGWQVTPNLIQSLWNSLWRYGLWPGNEHYVTGYKIACHFFKKQVLLVYTCLPVPDQITCTCFKFWSVCKPCSAMKGARFSKSFFYNQFSVWYFLEIACNSLCVW